MRRSACAFEVDGQPATFDIIFRNSLKTNGGWMFDLFVTFQASSAMHGGAPEVVAGQGSGGLGS